MLHFLADENFRKSIINGLLLREPNLDLVTVQEVGLRTKSDDVILEWAAQQNRIVLTHDVETMTDFAYQRIEAGRKMPGVIEVLDGFSIGNVIEEILLIAQAGTSADFEDQVWYLS